MRLLVHKTLWKVNIVKSCTESPTELHPTALFHTFVISLFLGDIIRSNFREGKNEIGIKYVLVLFRMSLTVSPPELRENSSY